MEARPSRIECPEPSEQPEPTNPGRVLDTERVAPRDATESVTEQLARGGSRDDGAVDETYDTRVKIGEALEGSARAIGDKPVERSDAAAICTAEACAVGGGADRGAIPGGTSNLMQTHYAATDIARTPRGKRETRPRRRASATRSRGWPKRARRTSALLRHGDRSWALRAVRWSLERDDTRREGAGRTPTGF